VVLTGYATSGVQRQRSPLKAIYKVTVTNTEFRIRLFDFLVVLGIYPLLLLNANATNAKKHSGVVFWDTDHFILGVGYMWH